jgi:uncharacterized protein YbaR (Trm112 family)
MRAPLDLLRCPADGSPLSQRNERTLACASAGHGFPVVDGVPVLIDDETSLFTANQVAGSATVETHRTLLERVAYRIRPEPKSNPGAGERFGRFRDLLYESGDREPLRVLVIGGGELGEGMSEIDGDPRLEFIETDVYISERVAVACDAHRLPFASGAFDGVVVQAVLEHVLSPPDVVAEIHRVLRDTGVVYAETPFMQGVHEGAYDFTRFTDLGHRRLFAMFEEIERGIAVGPATSLLWALRYFARALPRRAGIKVRLGDFAVSCAATWLVRLDGRLVRHPGAYDFASGFYFLGRRAKQPLSDRVLVTEYRGVAAGKSAEDRGV